MLLTNSMPAARATKKSKVGVGLRLAMRAKVVAMACGNMVEEVHFWKLAGQEGAVRFPT